MCTILRATVRCQTTDLDGTSRVTTKTLTVSRGGQRHTRGAGAATWSPDSSSTEEEVERDENTQ